MSLHELSFISSLNNYLYCEKFYEMVWCVDGSCFRIFTSFPLFKKFFGHSARILGCSFIMSTPIITHSISAGIINELNVISSLAIRALSDFARAVVFMSESHADLIGILFPYSYRLVGFKFSKLLIFRRLCQRERLSVRH